MANSIYQCSPGRGACLCQGEILSGLIRFRLDCTNVDESEPKVVQVDYPYAVVLSQACDLAQDFSGRKDSNPQLPDVLFCQLPTAEELKATPGLNSKIWDRIKKNKDERYHFLEKIPMECDACEEGIPELGVDFKRYFTIPTEEVYSRLSLKQTRRRCVLSTPYLEHLSTRFAYFLSRIALPSDHTSE